MVKDSYMDGFSRGVSFALSALKPTPSHVILSRLKAIPTINRGMAARPSQGWAAEFDRQRKAGVAMPDVQECRKIASQ